MKNMKSKKDQPFAGKLNVNVEFKALDEQLQNFKIGNELIFKKLRGEISSVNLETVSQWRQSTLENLMNEYNEAYIFKADDNALFYKLLPEKCLVFISETCSEEVRIKQILIFLAAANIFGAEKLPFLKISSRKPHCFKGIKWLPVIRARLSQEWA